MTLTIPVCITSNPRDELQTSSEHIHGLPGLTNVRFKTVSSLTKGIHPALPQPDTCPTYIHSGLEVYFWFVKVT